MKKIKRRRLSVWRILALGYLCVIALGSVLLTLPCATVGSQSTSYLNALFTATSATCVTGLVPYDTATHWTVFGQSVILLLIQTGGLGFMTVVSVLFIVIGRNMGMHTRRILMVSAGGGKLNGLYPLIKRIVLGTIICEVTGAGLLMIRFIPDFGAGRGIYLSFWHSVSAFCNAGFDVMGRNTTPFGSLSAYADDPVVSLTVCALIILGGLGFCVWGDVIDSRFNWKKFQLNTKIVLITTGVLLISGTALFLLFERNNPTYTDYNFGEKLLCAFFNSTTPRTAGFFTTDPTTLSDSGYMLTILLMFVGGSSGSTAGGIKVGTFAVIIMGMIAVFRGRRDINIGKRRVEFSLVSQALAILAACLMIIILATTAICAIEANGTIGVRGILFEVVSALGTSGLSLSATPYLAPASRIILIVLMYTGRVGILTLALALGEKKSSAEIKKPVDTLLIG